MQRYYEKNPKISGSFRNLQLEIKERFRKKARPGLIPTFGEFVKYLVSINNVYHYLHNMRGCLSMGFINP